MGILTKGQSGWREDGGWSLWWSWKMADIGVSGCLSPETGAHQTGGIG